jgi:serine/threonine protein phosphatase PrpC
VSDARQSETSFTAAGATDAGRRREVNEDRFHCDPTRGLFFVIDGVGGQAAGGKAADVALSMLKTRLERETGPVAARLREAIAIANDEIYALARTRPEWKGMACVLTAAVVRDGKATIGHVGDTRLYKLRGGRVEKVTRDHSPVGEREDTNEISEAQAMRHPRRNEVYRDVGSEPHAPDDPEFVDVDEIDVERDAALLICSDGLTDLVSSSTIARIVGAHAGNPSLVVEALIAEANAAGGKDNVTAIFIEGADFAAPAPPARKPARTALVATLTAVASAVATFTLLQPGLLPLVVVPQALPIQRQDEAEVVTPFDSIAAAIERARPGSQVIVEPGEYREQIRLRSHVRVVSRIPRGATIRLPVSATEVDPAVIASGISNAELVGFRIVGDAATPLGVGLFATNATVTILDVEISGATRVAVDLSSGALASVVGSDIHDNPGAGLSIRAGAAPRVAHSTFARNGAASQTGSSVMIDSGAEPVLYRNVFQGVTSEGLGLPAERARTLAHDNWFIPAPRPNGPATVPGPRR